MKKINTVFLLSLLTFSFGFAQNDLITPIVANTDLITTNEETVVTVNVSANDVDVDTGLDLSSLAISTAPDNGTTSVNTTTGEITYTPNKDFFGKDTLIYQISGNNGTSDTAYVIIDVNSVVDQIIANLDVTSTNEETVVTVNVAANDVDVDTGLDLSSLVVSANPKNGTASTNTTTGEITYTPNTDFFGKDTLIYTISGNNGTSDTAYFIIDVKQKIVTSNTDDNQITTFIYPNPSNGVFNIIHCKEDAMITIYNTIGEMIITTSAKIIDLGNQPNGVYFYQIQDETGIKTGQLIKQ